MKTFYVLLILLLPLSIFAQSKQDTSYWKAGGNFSLNFSETSFTNWAAGGKSSVSGVGLAEIPINYAKEKISWENAFNFGYGLLKEGKAGVQKSEDKIELNSKFGYKTKSKNLLYSALLNFLTQFGPGYNPDTSDKISDFLAPAYLTLALGMDFKPSDKLSLFLSPVSSKITIVNDLSLSENFGLPAGKKARGEFGALFKAELKTPVVKNVNVETHLGLFSNYLNKPQNIDVNWDFLVNMKVNDFLSANFISNLIYDDNIKIGVDKNGDGIIDSYGPRIQFKQILGIGLNYRF